jgi:hypothetical protein
MLVLAPVCWRSEMIGEAQVVQRKTQRWTPGVLQPELDECLDLSVFALILLLTPVRATND